MKLPALVLLHGFGEDHRVWNGQLLLAVEARVLVPDLPGTGAEHALHPCTMEHLASWLAAYLDREGVERCVMIGHSMGGYVALAFAERWPERLLGLGLAHSTAFADTEGKIDTRRKGMDFIRRNGADAFLKTTIPNLYSEKTRMERPELVEDHVREATGMHAETLLAYYEAMIERSDRTQLLKDAQIPLLFILGRQDNAVPLADSLAQCHLPSLSQVYLLETAGHMGMRECLELTTKHLRNFLCFINHRAATE